MKVIIEKIETLSVEADLAETLKFRRIHLKLNQQELAKRLGCSAMALSHYERGNRGLKIDLIERWATELGYKINLTLTE